MPPERNEEPADELGEMAAGMLRMLKALDGSKGVRAVVFLENDEKCMTALDGWDDDRDAVAAVMAHMTAVLKTAGVTMKVIGVPRIGHD